MTASQPIALLGGTFDPVHAGHVGLADDARRSFRSADVRLVPAADPPHRPPPGASAAHRLAMLELAIAGNDGLSIDTREIKRGGKSYTVLTLEELRRESPRRPLLLVVGADAFLGLPTWHRWHDIFSLAHVIVVARPGVELESSLPAALAAEWKKRRATDSQVLFSTPAGAIYQQAIAPQPISATAIRAELARGAQGRSAVGELLPPAVLAYIDQHRLYSTPPDAT